MRNITRLALASVLFAAGCPGDDENIPPVIDAATDGATVDMAPCLDCDGGLTDGATIDMSAIDAPIDAASSVMVVTPCPGNPDLEISAATGAYVPMTATINVNDVVEFTPGGGHNMISGTPGAADGIFSTTTGEVTCLRFTVAGTFPFFCGPHQFTGSLTVQ